MHHFVLGKLATTSIRVNRVQSQAYECELRTFKGHSFVNYSTLSGTAAAAPTAAAATAAAVAAAAVGRLFIRAVLSKEVKETYELGIPLLGLELGLGIRSSVRVSLRVW